MENTSPIQECQILFKKKHFSLIKNARQDSQGVSPLKDNDTLTMFSQSKDKANLLNKQFQSVFS